jgi:hypothetical protein
MSDINRQLFLYSLGAHTFLKFNPNKLGQGREMTLHTLKA